jgi:hypothetical protein
MAKGIILYLSALTSRPNNPESPRSQQTSLLAARRFLGLTATTVYFKRCVSPKDRGVISAF